MSRLSRKSAVAHLRELGIDFVPKSVSRHVSPALAPVAVAPRATAVAPSIPFPSVLSTETLTDIAAELDGCTRCPLATLGRSKVVFGVGNPKARVMFVGEGPGEEEDRHGEPFVGRAGKLLDKWIARLGLVRADVYIANIVKCRPPENRNPEPDEAKICLHFLHRQIRSIRPEFLVTLGRISLTYLLDSSESITKVRGQWRDFDGIPVLLTYHPAYVLRSPSREAEVFEDIDALSNRLKKG